MKTFQFNSEPEYAELWDVCAHDLLYDPRAYVNDILGLFQQIGITKNSRILDTCAGTGFVSLYLRQKGFHIDCMDLMADPIRGFKRRAMALGVSPTIDQLSWKDIPLKHTPNSYDFLFCRGNSFIYADGGWNKDQVVNQESSLKSYEETLKIFYQTLKIGGHLYIDKFFDDKKYSKHVVAKIRVGSNEEDLIFYAERFPEEGYRIAKLIRRSLDGTEKGLENITYDLHEEELDLMLRKVGFKDAKRIKLASEELFAVWLAKKFRKL